MYCQRHLIFVILFGVLLRPGWAAESRPNVILVMADDMGWGETGYGGHLVLRTPNLDAMAANGLRFDRFYAGAPVCSPTRASVLTGRANDRAGVVEQGYALLLQEKTLAQALKRRVMSRVILGNGTSTVCVARGCHPEHRRASSGAIWFRPVAFHDELFRC